MSLSKKNNVVKVTQTINQILKNLFFTFYKILQLLLLLKYIIQYGAALINSSFFSQNLFQTCFQSKKTKQKTK
jgi:hypothetical protein